MIIIVLACVLGVTLVVYLLFRRLRELSWQLTQLRVEHDSEMILRAIGVPPQIGVVISEPVRRKRHLRMYRGGRAPAALTGLLQGLFRHRLAAVASAGMVVAVVTTALVLDTARSQENDEASSSTPPASEPEWGAPAQAEPLKEDSGTGLDPERVPATGDGGAGRYALDIALTPAPPSAREPTAPTSTRPPRTQKPTPPPVTTTPPAPSPVSTPSTSDGLCTTATVPLVNACLPGRV